MTFDVETELVRVALYLGVPFIFMVFGLQWYWARVCDRNIQVLEAGSAGGGRYKLAPKEGGMVSIHNPVTNETRTWPVNELATIDVTYPGLGFIPRFLQKTIRLAILNEGDWEPVLNRSPHRRKVASPDVIEFLQSIAAENEGLKKPIDLFLVGVSTGPTREMIGDPAALGNLMRSGVLKALATVGDDLLEMLKGLRSQITRVAGLNPTIMYIGMGLTVILLSVLLYYTINAGTPEIASMADKIDALYKAHGIVAP